MKKIDLQKLENIQGGDFIEGACAGFGIGTTVLALANVWNPSGWLLLGVGVGCAGYAILR
ncbi:hypothetical protein [Lutibacter sp.]